MPDVAGPDGLTPSIEISGRPSSTRCLKKMRRLLAHRPPFEFRPVEPPKFLEPAARPARKHVWMRAWNPLPDEPALHRNLLAYVFRL